MPHFILECSDDVLEEIHPDKLIKAVFETANDSNLFNAGDIKVRTRSYAAFTVGGECSPFVHVFAWIMEGRSVSQKKQLSMDVVSVLTQILPGVPVVSMNVAEFEKATYSNRIMVQERS